MSAAWVEWLGYAASIVVLISLLMANIVRLRWINMAGALLFTFYGAAIGALPVAFVNFAIVLIDLYYLYLHYSAKERFDLVEVDASSELFGRFLDRHAVEITLQAEPDELRRAPLVGFVMLDDEIVGAMAGGIEGETLEILLDYTTPKYRDYRVGRYFFVDHPEFFRERGITRILARAYGKSHAEYLEKMGFRPLEGERWEKRL